MGEILALARCAYSYGCVCARALVCVCVCVGVRVCVWRPLFKPFHVSSILFVKSIVDVL